MAHQIFRSLTRLALRNSDACRDKQLKPCHFIRLHHGLLYAAGDQLRIILIRKVVGEYNKLVPSLAAYRVRRANDSNEPSRYRGQQQVADRVSQAVVDQLETI